MKLALRENMTPGDSLPDQLDWLAGVGFDGIELCGPALDLPDQELKAIFADSPVRPANLGSNPDLISPDTHKRHAAFDTILRRIDLAASLGAVGVLTVAQFGQPFVLPDLTPYKSAHELEQELLVAQLRKLQPAAAAAGVTVFLEPLNRYEQHLINRLDQGVAVAEQVGPGIAIMADFFHMNIEEDDLATSLRSAAPHVVHVHLADSNRRLPGKGHLDFRAPFAALKEAAYDGYFGIECRLDTPVREELLRSADLIRQWWEEA